MASISPQIARLFQAASDAQSRGDRQAAQRALEAVLAQEPQNPRALNSLGNLLLNAGQVTEAISLLERATAADPQAPPLWFNLSLAYRSASDTMKERAALQKCLAADPYFLPAILNMGAVFERQGNIRIAARYFRDAIACAAHAPPQSPQVQQQLAHAQKRVDEHNTELHDFLRQHVQQLAGNALHLPPRFAESLEIFSGRRKYEVQQPTFYAYPALPPIAFYERSHFPWIDAVEANWEIMRSELMEALGDSQEFVPYVAHGEGRPLGQWRELNHSLKWSAYHLLKNGEKIADHAAKCHKTMETLALAPQPHVLHNAPNAFFSHLLPHTHIPPHTGMTNTRLVVHVPLIVPEACFFRVGNHKRHWQEGKAWVFDDTIEHEALNNSDKSRIILIFDVWNPLLSADEQQLITQAIKAHQLFYGADAETLGNI